MNKITKEEIDLIVKDFFQDKIAEVERNKYAIEDMKIFFNVKYNGGSSFTVNANRNLDEYILDEITKRHFKIKNIWPRPDNQGPVLTIELTFVKPKGKDQ